MRKACEACAAKFGLFNRRKLCMDCRQYFCTECIIKRKDRMFNCDNCILLSQRPLIKSQIIQIKARHLRQYLKAKNINTEKCLEKEDLVSLIILYITRTEQHNGRSNSSSYPDNQRNISSRVNERQMYFDAYQSESSNADSEIDRQMPSTFARSNESENINASQSQNQTQTQYDSEYNQINDVSQDSENNSRSYLFEEITNEMSDDIEELNGAQSILSEQIVESVDDLEEFLRLCAIDVYNSVEIEEVTDNENLTNPGTESSVTTSEETRESPLVNETNQQEDRTKVRTWPDKIKLSDIKVSDELNQLTTKQLKYLLAVNRVEFKGCIERHELFDKVLRLWKDYKQPREGLGNDHMSFECKICLDAPMECVILECGHIACCIDCGIKLSECPICRQYIVRVVRIFRS